MEIKTKKHFNEVLKQLTLEVIDEEELGEITSTSGAPGFSTPKAFRKKKKKDLDEALEPKDIEEIRKLIKDVVGDIYRDIWLKRNSWK